MARHFGIEDHGPGFCHFPEAPPYTRAHFRGLTAEVRREHKKQGRIVYTWELPLHRRNEPLDCRVMAYAALEGLKENRLVDLSVKLAPTAPRRTVARTAPPQSSSRGLFGPRGSGSRRSLF